MTGDLHYEAATVEDVPVIFAQSKALVDAYEDCELIDYTKVMNWLEKKISTNIAAYTCIKMDGQKVAYYRLCHEDDRIELDDFYVLPGFRNTGIGTCILKRCLQMADKPLYLYVFTENAGAISLYQKHGFTVTEQVSTTRLIMTFRS